METSDAQRVSRLNAHSADFRYSRRLMFLAIALLIATQATPANPAVAPAVRVLVMDLRNDGVPIQTARILGDAMTSQLAARRGLAVVSAEDVRRAVEFEGQKRELGCDTNQCIAEIAQAMGADHVVFGNVGALGAMTIVSLTWHDAKKGESLARRTIEVDAVEDLSPRVRVGVDALADEAFGIVREDGPSPVFVAGAVVVGVGAVTAVAGAAVALWSASVVNDNGAVVAGKNDGPTKLNAQGSGQAGIALLVVGTLVTAVGAGVAAYGALE